MKSPAHPHPALALALLLAAVALLASRALPAAEISNNQYTLAPLPDNAIEVRTPGVPAQRLEAEFTVMYSERNPGFGMNWAGPFDRPFPRPFPAQPNMAQRWTFYSDDPAAPERELQALGVRSDIEISVNSKGERILHYRDTTGKSVEKMEGDLLKGTLNPYLAGQKTILRATASTVTTSTLTASTDTASSATTSRIATSPAAASTASTSSAATAKSIRWSFPEHANFALSAEVALPDAKGDPQIRYRLRVKKAGYYSVAFTGAPWVKNSDAIPVPHSVLNPTRATANFLLSEAHVTLPRIHLATAKLNSALVVDPAESPFRLLEDSKGVWTYVLARESNSRFGLMTEAGDGRIRPVVFSPIMGGHESLMKAGDSYQFTVRYVLRPGPWQDTFRHIARDIFRFRDMRDNSGPGPIYHTLENLMDYLSERDTANYCMWHAEQKYHNYWSDQSGIFKPFSPLFALSAAIVTDDENYYRTRALPMVEFALSRKTNMFTPYDVAGTGMVSSLIAPLGAPYVDAGQLGSLDGMFQSRTYAFRHYAATQEPGKNPLMNALAQYRATGDKKFLDEAGQKAGAKPRGLFMNMLEMYEETGQEKYLRAALDDAYRYISIQNLYPSVPDEDVTVDKGGVAPIHGHAYQRHEDWGFAPPRPVRTPGQTVPAWRVSLIGTELSAYRGGYWLNNHGQLMRLAAHANDDFLRDLQRWALVGRFGNHAGDFRSNRHSLVGELPDAPMHYIYDTNYSTFNPGHACEWLGAIIDFIVSDLFDRSEKQIDFPSRCMYDAGFRTKVYGDRAGRFYDEQNVRLWLPRRLLESDNKQVDYVAGHGNGKFYAAFINQSFRAEKVTVRLNPALVDCSGNHRARIWIGNEDKGSVAVSDNTISFEIAPKGIVAYAIEGAKVTLGLHSKLFAADAPKLGPDSLATAEAPFGRVNAMLITAGKGLTTSFVYTDAPAAKVISAKLRHRQGGAAWQEITDAIFPYEFTTPIDETKGRFECVLEVETADQTIQKSPVLSVGF